MSILLVLSSCPTYLSLFAPSQVVGVLVPDQYTILVPEFFYYSLRLLCVFPSIAFSPTIHPTIPAFPHSNLIASSWSNIILAWLLILVLQYAATIVPFFTSITNSYPAMLIVPLPFPGTNTSPTNMISISFCLQNSNHACCPLFPPRTFWSPTFISMGICSPLVLPWDCPISYWHPCLPMLVQMPPLLLIFFPLVFMPYLVTVPVSFVLFLRSSRSCFCCWNYLLSNSVTISGMYSIVHLTCLSNP